MREMLKVRIDRLIYKTLFAFLFLILLMLPTKNSMLVSMGTYGIFVCTGLAVAFGFYENRIVAKDVLPVLILAICGIVSMICSKVSINKALVRYLMFMELPLLLMSMPDRIDRSIVRFYSVGLIFLSVFFVYQASSGNAYVFYSSYGKGYISDLTLGYNNPNETAMYLFCTQFGLINAVVLSSNKWVKLFLSVLAGILLYLVFLTNSRTVMVLSVLLLVIMVFLRKRKPSVILTINVVAFSFAFVVILIVFSSTLTGILFWGDAFDTGRSEIYSSVINNLTLLKSIFGDFDYEFDNLHNAPLSIFATIGIVGVTVFYYILLSWLLGRIRTTKFGKCTYLGMWSVLMIFVHSSVEAAMLTAGSAFAVCSFSAFLFAQYEVSNESITD